jgi:tetratricopeptide (TPR) repeat protein
LNNFALEQTNLKLKMNKFNQEWEQTAKLFGILIASESFNINLNHPLTKKKCNPHEALFEVVEKWRKIQSPWDRRSLLFQTIFNLVAQYLKPWQIANYLVADRQPLEAFEILQEFISRDLKEDHSQYCASLARSLSSLSYYEDSLTWALKAHLLEPDNLRFKVLLADAYYLVERFDEANQTYQSYLPQVSYSENDSTQEMFQDVFSLEHGLIPSPIFAIQFTHLLADEIQLNEFWDLAATEFYYSPYFRSHHAYYLADKGQIKECLAKLIALVQEMPWLREASLNLEYLFECFNKRNEIIMPDFQRILSERIHDQGWTKDGIFILQVSSENV